MLILLLLSTLLPEFGLLSFDSYLYGGPYGLKNKGVRFFRYTIRDIISDKWGNLYFGTYGSGMGVISRKGFRVLTSKNSFLPENRVNCFHYDSDKDRLLIGTCGGITIYYPGEGKHQTFTTEDGLARNITHTINAHEGTIYVGTTGSGLALYSKKGGFSALSKSTTEGGLGCDWINGHVFDKTGQMWVGTGDGLYSFSKESGWQSKNPFPGIAYQEISHLDYSAPNLWVATFKHGAVRINPETGKSLFFNKKNGLPSNEILYIEAISKDKAWLATLKGLTLVYKEKIMNFGVRHGLTDLWIKSVYKDKYSLYAGSSKGILYAMVRGRFVPLVSRMRPLPALRQFIKNLPILAR